MTLKELLKDWTDYDVAEYYLACSLGLMKYDDTFTPNTDYAIGKAVFWTNDPLGNSLYEILEKLVALEILVKNEDMLFRWNQSYKGYWEK